jgi:glyoxylase-like metal-dependent hydrolase (beta-lactamase superfamily II)
MVGDLFCTVSPGLGRPVSPRLQSRGSNADSSQALMSVARLETLDARVLLPGHGRSWRDGVESAVDSVRRFGCW